jgi:hypothetical protein
VSKVKRLGSKELDAARRRARKSGWEVTRLGSGHLRWVAPTGVVVTTPGTPNGISLHMALRRLRRAGLS